MGYGVHLVTRCHFDHFMAQGQKWDHLFLVREGWHICKSWKFKVVTFEPVFETGSMAGLINENR